MQSIGTINGFAACWTIHTRNIALVPDFAKPLSMAALRILNLSYPAFYAVLVPHDGDVIISVSQQDLIMRR